MLKQVQILSTETEMQLTSPRTIQLFDESSDLCWGPEYLNTEVPICKPEKPRMSQTDPELPMMSQHEPAPACCCNRTACSIGTFESILTVMKESMFPPHAVEIDWNLSNLTGDLTKGAHLNNT